MNGSRITCELCFFGGLLIIMKKAFVSQFAYHILSNTNESNGKANESKPETKSENEKDARKRERITHIRTKILLIQLQMNGKKAYKVPISDNSISILLHSSAVPVMYCA